MNSRFHHRISAVGEKDEEFAPTRKRQKIADEYQGQNEDATSITPDDHWFNNSQVLDPWINNFNAFQQAWGANVNNGKYTSSAPKHTLQDQK